MAKETIKISVTGAAGQIGYSLLFRIASGQMFGQKTTVELSLLDLEPRMSALEGVIMELNDCAFPLIKDIKKTYILSEAFEEIDWAFLVGSVPRKTGMERSDLLKVNGKIFEEQGKAISENAKTSCKILVVGNPCNTNAYIAKSVSKKISEKNFYALTMLDQNRAVAQLSSKAEVDIGEIKNLAIWGNHSLTQYPDFYNATIKGKPVSEVIDEQWLKKDFLETVQKRGAQILNARGVSSAASAANAVIDTVQRVIKPTDKNEYFSLGVSSDGSYGVEPGLIFSFPVQSDGENIKIVQGIKHNKFSQEKINTSIKELLSEKEMVESFISF